MTVVVVPRPRADHQLCCGLLDAVVVPVVVVVVEKKEAAAAVAVVAGWGSTSRSRTAWRRLWLGTIIDSNNTKAYF
jgi:hypothetical protein